MNATQIGMLVGALAAPLVVIVIGFVVANQMNKSREFEDQVKWPIGVGFVLAFLMLPGLCSGPNNPSTTNVADEENAVEVIDGVVEAPFPDEIDQTAINQNRLTITDQLEDQFYDEFGPINSTLEQQKMGGQTVLFYTAVGDKGPRMMQYIGVINDRRKIVACVSMAGEDFAECHQRGVEIFGPLEEDPNG
ncbi:MAG: hypothetical protein AAGH57_14815 [Pseudomonadota bacterium]